MRQILHRFELRLAIMAVVALLMAQLGAVSHAYSHDAFRDAYSHDVGGGSLPTHTSGASSHNPCDECLGYAPLLAVAGTPTLLPFLEPQERGLATPPIGTASADIFPTLAFRSRAPPAWL